MAEEQVIKMENKLLTFVWVSLKILIFFGFFYTSFVMFRLRDTTTATLILFAASLFLIFNRMDSINKRLKLLEEK